MMRYRSMIEKSQINMTNITLVVFYLVKGLISCIVCMKAVEIYITVLTFYS